MEKTFIRVRSIRDIVIFISLIVIGSVLVALPTGAGVNIAGFFMIFAGLILSLILKSGYKDEETGESKPENIVGWVEVSTWDNIYLN